METTELLIAAQLQNLLYKEQQLRTDVKRLNEQLIDSAASQDVRAKNTRRYII